jgi:AcrR family transcriptional regulator
VYYQYRVNDNLVRFITEALMNEDASQSAVAAEVSAPLGLREQSKREVTRRIRAAAVDLLARKPFSEITTREVAQHAGIGEATLFRYVGSKDELLTLAYGDRMAALLDELQSADDRVAAAANAGRPGDWYCARVRSFYEGRADFYLQDPLNAALYLRQGFDMASAGRTRTIAQGDRLIERVRSILAAGQSDGALLSRVDPLSVAQNCHGIFIHEVDRTLTRGFQPSTIWQRVHARLNAQLDPLVLDQHR